MKNIGFFYLKNCHFLVVKFSVYLNRRVFIMLNNITKQQSNENRTNKSNEELQQKYRLWAIHNKTVDDFNRVLRAPYHTLIFWSSFQHQLKTKNVESIDWETNRMQTGKRLKAVTKMMEPSLFIRTFMTMRIPLREQFWLQLGIREMSKLRLSFYLAQNCFEIVMCLG